MMYPKWYCTSTVNRPDHDCIDHFNLRRAQNANLNVHQSGSDVTFLNDNILATALDKVVTFAGEVLFERKSDFNQAGGDSGERTDLSTRSTTYTRRERANISYLILDKSKS